MLSFVIRHLSSMKNAYKAHREKRLEQRIASRIKSYPIPHHIGIILDGNRRYARVHHLPTILAGHEAGVDRLEIVMDWCYELGVKMLTVWAFSTENIHRTNEEKNGIFNLIRKKALALITDERIHKNQIQARVLGDLHLLPDSTRDALKQMELETARYSNFYLNIAVGYGGKKEVLDAFDQVLQHAEKQKWSIADLRQRFSEQMLRQYFYLPDIPDPELIIRTSGEIRTSGFMLWQSAYSEYYFCPSFWPAFSRLDLVTAIDNFQRRQRRFGK
jgi:undecaprenyl diphosphate synthase